MSKDMEVKLCPDCKGKGEVSKEFNDIVDGYSVRNNKIVRCDRCWGSGRIMITTEITETPFYKP